MSVIIKEEINIFDDTCGLKQEEEEIHPNVISVDCSTNVEENDKSDSCGPYSTLSQSLYGDEDVKQEFQFKEKSRSEFDNNLFGCLQCGQRFPLMPDLMLHLPTHRKKLAKESKKESFRYEICGEFFRHKLGLRQHIRVHNGKQATRPFRCDICIKRFRDKGEIRRHINRHLNIRAFKCNVCHKRFFRKHLLKNHIAFCGCSFTKEKFRKKLCSCDECGQGFSDKTSLRYHLMKHMGYKLGCSFCDKSFIIKSDLVNHVRTHTGERPFACTECPKRFIQRSKLVRHSRTHSNEKPYYCVVCSKNYRYSWDFRKHRLSHA